MKKKSIILSILALLVPLAAVGTAFASFSYSTKVDKEDKQSGAYIDDIKPNFKIKEDDYTVYFFPSMQFASDSFLDDEGNVMDETSIREKINTLNPTSDTSGNGTDFGRWNEDALADILATQASINDYLQYYPKKVVTKGGPTISLDEYKKVGEPFTTKKDEQGNVLEFAGWSADKDAVTTCYGSQGDYKLVSAFDDFYSADNDNVNDGTKQGDHIVFLYPIFTTGKDFKKQANSSIKLENEADNRNYYFSQYGDGNKGYYYLKNIIISKEETWAVKLNGVNSKDGGWYDSWRGYHKDGEDVYFYSPDKTCAIKEPGIYNAYIYLFRGAPSLNKINITDANDFMTWVYTNNSVPLVYYDAVSSSKQEFAVEENDKFWIFLKVERVFEYKLLGTEDRGFSYETGGQLHMGRFSSLYPGVDTLKEYSPSGPWKAYYLDNVYFESTYNYSYNQFASNSNEIYKVKKKVFSFLGDSEEMNVPFSPMGQDELDYVNKMEQSNDSTLAYETFSLDSEVFSKLDNSNSTDKDGKKYIDFGNATDSNGFPFEYDKNNYLDYFFTSNLKYSSYCRVLILVYFSSTTGFPTEIKVALAPYQKDSYTLYVYPNFGFAYDGPKFGSTSSYKNDYLNYLDNGLNSRKDPSTGLIDPEQDQFLEQIVIAKIKVYKKNDYMLDGYELEDSSGNRNEQTITLKGVGSISVKNYLNNYLPNNNKEIIDHITGRTIQMNLQFKRFVACYITDIQ